MSTRGTLIEAINICENHESKEKYAGATHGIFAGDVIERLDKSCAKKVVVTNKIPNEKLNQSLNLIATVFMAIDYFPKMHGFPSHYKPHGL